MPPNVRPGRGSVRVVREVAETWLNFETILGCLRRQGTRTLAGDRYLRLIPIIGSSLSVAGPGALQGQSPMGAQAIKTRIYGSAPL